MSDPLRHALVVSSSRYSDPSLQPLTAPMGDTETLAAVLRDPAVGAFRVREIVDQPSWVVAEEVERFFSERSLSDLALFYFSGHGIKDQDGALYFAAMNTKRELLRSTAVPSDHMVAAMRRCRSRQQVLLLDCCYAGAFSRAMLTKGDERVGVQERFATEGAGRVVITASDALQYALEGDELQGETTLSVFTRALVEGIRTGEADQNRDGRVSLDELYDYVYDRVRQVNPNQTPTTSNLDKRGEIVIALNPHASAAAGERSRAPEDKPAMKPKPRRAPQRKEKPAARALPPGVTGRDQLTRTTLERMRRPAQQRAAPQRARRGDARDQQRGVLSELALSDALARGTNVATIKEQVDLLQKHLESDEELLGACQIEVPSTLARWGVTSEKDWGSGLARRGVLGVTSRRLVWLHPSWSGAPKFRDLPYNQITAARLGSGFSRLLTGPNLIISASTQDFEFVNVRPRDRADALATLINERAQRTR
jgi:uncharacterized caspase-like protein